VLRRIDLDIRAGEFVSIMGPSGAGKSTLLHILGMHDQSWSGEYYFDDVRSISSTERNAPHCESEHRFVFQSYHLLDDQTVFENLELPLSYRDVSKKDRQSIVCDTLDRFQMVGKKISSRLNFQAVNNNSWASRARLLRARESFLPTSRLVNLHSAQGKEIMDMFKR
jgi:ABC-type lipoprotein export system ATPase subunit